MDAGSRLTSCEIVAGTFPFNLGGVARLARLKRGEARIRAQERRGATSRAWPAAPHRRQKNTIPPNAKPFMCACSPTTGFDVVRLTSPTNVTLLVSP